MAMSKVTREIIQAAGMRPPDTSKVPFYLMKNAMRTPKEVRQQVIDSGVGIIYVVRCRTNLKGRGFVTLYETNWGPGDLRGNKVAEIETLGLQHADNVFDNVVRTIHKYLNLPANKPPVKKFDGNLPFVDNRPQNSLEGYKRLRKGV